MSVVVKYIPRKIASRFVGFLFNLKGPWADWIKIRFIAAFKIAVHEAEKPLDQYPTLGDFFIRRLKPGLRPLAQTFAVVPADSFLSQIENISSESLIQAKGISYNWLDFIRDPQGARKYKDGTALTFYLSPRDYHRVHSPVKGLIKRMVYVPGDLWPVNQWSLENVPQVFNLNERVILEIETELGSVTLVFVGATNVGSIHIKCRPDLVTNSSRRAFTEDFAESIPIEKGAELGMFKLGSTVVVILNSNITRLHPISLQNGISVKVNSALTQN